MKRYRRAPGSEVAEALRRLADVVEECAPMTVSVNIFPSRDPAALAAVLSPDAAADLLEVDPDRTVPTWDVPVGLVDVTVFGTCEVAS